MLAAHYWLAYARNSSATVNGSPIAARRVNRSPLGAAALAGTSLPIDRQMVGRRARFRRSAANSLDASSDRDFVLEFVFCLSMIAEHLSGWAEEWILWSTTEFGFLKLPHAFCTGSSIMPHKMNPDVLELIRGKTGRVIGDLTALLGSGERPAAGLQPRPAGRQTATLRRDRNRTGFALACRGR